MFILETFFGTDVSFTVLAYSIARIIFGMPFDFFVLGFCIFVSLLPDIDFIPFLFVRKKLKYSSHRRLGHHPIIVIPLYVALTTWTAINLLHVPLDFSLVLFTILFFFHFLHDATSTIGLHWFSPFSWKHYRLQKTNFVAISEKEIESFYHKKLQVRRGKDGSLQQLLSRSKKIDAVAMLRASVCWATLTLSILAFPFT
ncbi:MAG: metal-dependent hydrolase [Bacteroidota bacterium]